jgi:hypothetical protein
MPRLTSNLVRSTVWSLALVLAVGGAAACGGGAPSSHVQQPVVRAFSPFLSPIDFNNLQQNPTFTDGMLTVSTDPAYPGKIVIYFQDDTTLDPASIFLGGIPALGLDPSSVQVLRFIPGTGNVPLPLHPDPNMAVVITKSRIVVTPSPAVMPLPAGQYEIGVFKNVKNTEGKGLFGGPVFHSFTVGAADGVRPFVVTSFPVNNQVGVGAGAPPPTPPAGPAQTVADVRTNIFGPTSPDIVIRFNEAIDAATVNLNNIQVVDAGAFVPGGGAPPAIAPAAGFPKLKSEVDGATLPSNGHEIVWRADTLTGGFPFGTIVQVTLAGEDVDPVTMMPTNPNPIADLAGNKMETSFAFQFQTLAPPELPQNPFPEYAIWWAGSDRVGTLDTVNQQGLADQFTGALMFPFGVPRNSWRDKERQIPEFTDKVATAQNIAGFEPTEISIDTRTSGTTCHTWVYVMSPNSGQIVVVNSRNSIPVAIINTTTPGGLANQTGGGQAANVLLVTNSSANTLTTFDLSNVTPGTSFINGPIFVQSTVPTGNTPKAVSISLPATGAWTRDPGFGGPAIPLVMYIDFTDGVVNTTNLNLPAPVRQFNLGPNSAPNDVVMTPCFGLNPILFAAVSQGGLPNEGKVAYYVAGPGCLTGTSTGARPDSLVGDLSGFDGPSGMDEIFPMGNSALFAVAESGSQANRVVTLGVESGTLNVPRRLITFTAVGANPVAIAHRSAYVSPCVQLIGVIPRCSTNPSCWYRGTEQWALSPRFNGGGIDQSLASAQDLYICARGASQISVVNLVNGGRDIYSPISIPGIRFVASPATQ